MDSLKEENMDIEGKEEKDEMFYPILLSVSEISFT